jgi:hypothetical protein
MGAKSKNKKPRDKGKKKKKGFKLKKNERLSKVRGTAPNPNVKGSKLRGA